MAYPYVSDRELVISKYFGDPEARTLAGYEQRGRYQGLRKALGMTRRDHRRGEGVGPARARRRGLPDRREVELRAQGQGSRTTCAATPTSPEPGTFKDRELMRCATRTC